MAARTHVLPNILTGRRGGRRSVYTTLGASAAAAADDDGDGDDCDVLRTRACASNCVYNVYVLYILFIIIC